MGKEDYHENSPLAQRDPVGEHGEEQSPLSFGQTSVRVVLDFCYLGYCYHNFLPCAERERT